MSFSTGQANPNDYVIGRGIVYFSKVNASGFPVSFRDLGNCPEFSAQLESEKQEHTSSRQGLKTTDKEVVVELSASISFTLDEINLDNLAMFMSGSTSELSQAGGAVTGTENMILYQDVTGRPESALGRWYDIYLRADMSSGVAYPGGASDVRAYNLTAASVTVQVSGGGNTLTEDTDYIVDYAQGRILILDTAANRAEFVSGSSLQNETLDVDFTTTATEIQEANGLTESDISGALKFIQKNAANSSKQTEHQFHSVTLASDGDLSLIGDDFTTMQFTGSAESREAVDASSPVWRTRTYDGAGVA